MTPACREAAAANRDSGCSRTPSNRAHAADGPRNRPGRPLLSQSRQPRRPSRACRSRTSSMLLLRPAGVTPLRAGWRWQATPSWGERRQPSSNIWFVVYPSWQTRRSVSTPGYRLRSGARHACARRGAAWLTKAHQRRACGFDELRRVLCGRSAAVSWHGRNLWTQLFRAGGCLGALAGAAKVVADGRPHHPRPGGCLGVGCGRSPERCRRTRARDRDGLRGPAGMLGYGAITLSDGEDGPLSGMRQPLGYVTGVLIRVASVLRLALSPPRNRVHRVPSSSSPRAP